MADRRQMGYTTGKAQALRRPSMTEKTKEQQAQTVCRCNERISEIVGEMKRKPEVKHWLSLSNYRAIRDCSPDFLRDAAKARGEF